MSDTDRTSVTPKGGPEPPRLARLLPEAPTGGWIAALATAKGADSVTTLVVLQDPTIVEANPLVAAIHAGSGRLQGELLVMLVGVLGLSAAIEGTAHCIARFVAVPTPGVRGGLRATGYLTATLLLFSVAICNTMQYIIYW